MEGRSVREPSRRIHAFLHKRQNNNDASGTTLLANAVQTGSFTDGSINGAQKPGQSASKTSKNNFINNCSGKTLTNGLQVLAGSCNGIPMGDIPAKANMVSSIITFPEVGDTSIKANTTFKITVQMKNLVAGTFTNAATTYYAGPQFLQGGKIVGHTHVTVQDMGKTLNPTQPLDPTQFVFFKGINDAGDGNGLLSATVTGGLLAGNYRVCTMAAAANHQPVLMPVAQRGTPDDCTKFTVVADDQVTSSSEASSSTVSIAAVETSSSAESTSKAESTSTIKSSPDTTSSVPVSLPTSAALGGIAAPGITDSGDATRPFAVKGNTFVAKSAAVQRSCDVQFNACANAFNGGTAKGFNLADCSKQQDACVAAGA
ncbi:hypothetical protein BKA65DRAFT_398935 [Rhexocercosporidium sp. MPI-PUGE-AT-0058]|nr:hypothetical protein BKA65DRAFT_398935 [Rhexocercosporidium sp. MPI-PUGE-AT-0058]